MTVPGGCSPSFDKVHTPTGCSVELGVVDLDDVTSLDSSSDTKSVSSHHDRCHRGRRSGNVSARWKTGSFHNLLCILLLLVLACCVKDTLGQAVPNEGILLQSTLERLARRGEILVDRRLSPHMAQLQRRQVSSTTEEATSSSFDTSSSSSASSTPSDTTSTSTPSDTTSTTDSDLTTDPNAESSSLPTPFDTSLGNNFTSNSCPDFFQRFLRDPNFQNCLPFSLLLRNSDSFFQASKSGFRVTQALDATCNVNFPACSSLMNGLAQDIRKDANCGRDYRNENPLVAQAYVGLLAYEPLYEAGCQKSSTNSYCFADAITNTSSPSDSYVYYLPLGPSLPGGARPSCTKCLQDTMAIIATAATNATQAASRNYIPTAELINRGCGPDFVNANIPAVRGAAARVGGILDASGMALYGFSALVLLGGQLLL